MPNINMSMFLSESRRNRTVNCVESWVVCSSLLNSLVIWGVKYTYFTSHFLGNVNVLVVISLDIEVNVHHDISMYDFITI